MDYDNTNRGVLFPNKQKVDGDSKPELSGNINIDGKEYWLSCWDKVSKAGNEFKSLSVQPKEEQSKPKTTTPPQVDEDPLF